MYGDVSWLDTAGRLLIVFCFLATGLCNLTRARIRDHIERMAAFGTPLPATVFWTGIPLQFAGSAMLLFDWHADGWRVAKASASDAPMQLPRIVAVFAPARSRSAFASATYRSQPSASTRPPESPHSRRS